MILSIIIITHNQKELFRRCIESVLAQELPFEHEIIVSDDASTDGTWELIFDYVKKYPYTIKGVRCNSDECMPDMVSERAAYNRLNGLRHASGKYLIHVDGDDFFIENDCLKKQVEMLESHPECTICCQRYLWFEEGSNLSDGKKMFPSDLFYDGNVLTVDGFIRNVGYIHNSACCLRNERLVNDNIIPPTEYDDVDITYQYIKFGKIVLVGSCGFVYCHHQSNSASHFQKDGQLICWLTPISSSVIAPQCAGSLLRNGLSQIIDVLHYICNGVQLEDSIVGYLSKSPAFIFHEVGRSQSFFNRARYHTALFLAKLIRRFKLDGNIVFALLYKLLVSWNIPKGVVLSRLN